MLKVVVFVNVGESNERSKVNKKFPYLTVYYAILKVLTINKLFEINKCTTLFFLYN